MNNACLMYSKVFQKKEFSFSKWNNLLLYHFIIFGQDMKE